ncbi:hypothetical protein F4677DRAFT_320380 [Hypoxylon crocopeplum]|nr:hypothetical protein F4677DRAFT_320380 [Hypoxylon crocopeplum]
MAESRSTGLQPNLPMVSSGAQPQPRRLKLRDSCENCATSKLKCGREKPACSRCLKQSKACNYVESKRTGRLGATRSTRMAVANVTSTVTKRPIAWMGTPTPTPPPDSIHISLAQPSSIFHDMAPSGSIATLEDSSVLSPYNSTPHFFDTSDQGAIPWLNFDLEGFSNIDHINTSTASRDTSSSIELDLQGSIFSTPRHPSPIAEESTVETISTRTSIPHLIDFSIDSGVGLSPTPEGISSEPQCACMGRALRLLQQLSAQSRMARRPSCGSNLGHRRKDNQTTTPKSTVIQNRKNIQEICDIARCTCLEDPYLLSIICFLVIKVLSLYKSAVQSSKKTKTNGKADYIPDPIKSGEDEEEMRTVANSILRQLHLVQGVVSTLSPRLKANRPQADEGREEAAVDDAAGDKTDSDLEKGSEVLSLSANLLDQLEEDIRRHLRALSCEIVDILRRG